jgi:hypothetical protein
MRQILNLTQHNPTPEQFAQGVVDLSPEDRELLIRKLNFKELPNRNTLELSAGTIAHLARKFFSTRENFTKAGVDYDRFGESPAHQSFVLNICQCTVLIGGAPFFDNHLREALTQENLTIVYSFSQRVSVVTQLPDGSVEKKLIFKHIDFV